MRWPSTGREAQVQESSGSENSIDELISNRDSANTELPSVME